MKKRLIIFALALVLSGLALSGAGCYYKYVVLRPYGLAQDQFAPAIPILLLTDKGRLREQLRQAQDHIVAHEVIGKPRPVCARAHAARIQTAQDLPGRERLVSGHVDAPDKERRYRHRKHQQKQRRTQAAIPCRAPQQPRQTAPGYGRHRALAAPRKRRHRLRTALAHRKAQRIGVHRLGRRTRDAGIRAGIEHALRMRAAHLEPHAAAKRQDPPRQTHHLTQIRHTRSCRRSAPPRCPWPRAAGQCRAGTPACARRQ